MVQSGGHDAAIIDAIKMGRAALENTVPAAGTLLLTEATLTEEGERKTEWAPTPEFAE